MTTPAPAAGESPVDTKQWPIKYQVWAWIAGTVLNLLIAIVPPMIKDKPDDKNKDTYTKAEVQALIDSAVLNIRYSQADSIDGLYNWTLYTFQYNKLPVMPPPAQFKSDRNPPQPGFPQMHMQPSAPPPREAPVHGKKPPDTG